MPDIIDMLPQALIALVVVALLTLHIRDRIRSRFRVTFYLKNSGRKVVCNLANVESKHNGRTISWESPSDWHQTMRNVTPEDIVAIKVKDRRYSFCL